MRVLVSKTYMDGLQYQEIAGTSDEVEALPNTGLVTGSRFTCVDTGSLYIFDEKQSSWNGPFVLYEAAGGN